MPRNRIRFSDDFVLKNNQIGIGTSSPTVKLDVTGDLKVSGIITSPNIGTPSIIGKLTVATRVGAASTQKMELQAFSNNNGTLAFNNSGGNQLLTVNNTLDNDSDFKINQFVSGTKVNRTTFSVSSGGTVSIGSTYLQINPTNSSLNTYDTINVGTGLTNYFPYGQSQFSKTNIIRGSLSLLAPFSTSTQYINLIPRFLDSGALSFESPTGAARTNTPTQVFSVSNNFNSTIFRVNDLNRNTILEASTSGNIGFGTTNPLTKLHIVGAGSSSAIRLSSVASTSTENADIAYYRNIGYGTAVNNSGALSLEFTGANFGFSTTRLYQTPLLSLTNSTTDNLFSISAFTNASFVSGISSIPAFDVTISGKVGIGTTNPQQDFHVLKNTLITSGIVTVAPTSSFEIFLPTPNKISFASSITTGSNDRINLQNITPGIHTISAPNRRGIFYYGEIQNDYSGGQHFSVINDNSSIFTVNVFAGLSSTRFAPAGTRNIDVAIDVKSNGSIGFGTTNPLTFIQVGTGSSVISVTGIGSVGIGTTRPTEKVDVFNGNVRIGINTSNGLILTSANGTKYRLSVNNDGSLFTTVVT
jgi:hypothetical protein